VRWSVCMRSARSVEGFDVGRTSSLVRELRYRKRSAIILPMKNGLMTQRQGASNATLAVHARPALGESVDEVMRAFMKLSDEWCGIFVIEALLPVTNEGPARKYRVQSAVVYGKRTRIGVSLGDGLLIRDAKPHEEDELEECIGLGFAQISKYRRSRGGVVEVLHQATGRSLQSQAVGTLTDCWANS